MEDAATAEISRSQVWQWIQNGIELDTGAVVTKKLVHDLVREELAKLPGSPEDYAAAAHTFLSLVVSDDFEEFLTLPAYEQMA